MGLQSPHSIFWKTVKLPFDLALQVVQDIATKVHGQKMQELAASVGDEMIIMPQHQRLKLTMDANLVGYWHLGNCSSFNPDQAVFHIAKASSDKLVDVVIGTDGKMCHPSKRATCKHKADEMKAEIQLTIARANLHSLLHAHDVQSEAQHAEDIKKAQSRIVSLENQLKRQFLSNFADKLSTVVNEYFCQKGKVIYPFLKLLHKQTLVLPRLWLMERPMQLFQMTQTFHCTLGQMESTS
jgi:hypothetical protein